MITFNVRGNFNKTERFLANGLRLSSKVRLILENHGMRGVFALSSATPVDTGLSANEWSYKVEETPSGFSLSWYNANVDSNGTPIVILIQYGHGTRNGAYVQPNPFINEAIKPVIDSIVESIGKEVANL